MWYATASYATKNRPQLKAGIDYLKKEDLIKCENEDQYNLTFKGFELYLFLKYQN